MTVKTSVYTSNFLLLRVMQIKVPSRVCQSLLDQFVPSVNLRHYHDTTGPKSLSFLVQCCKRRDSKQNRRCCKTNALQL